MFMTYRSKYYTPVGRRSEGELRGRRIDPDKWCTGPDPVEHDKYYGFIKHRAQAQFRGEEYLLEYEDWQELWQGDSWFKRGRSVDSLCLARLDNRRAWRRDNVEVMPRRSQLKLPRWRNSDKSV